MAQKAKEECLKIERRQLTELKSFAAPPQSVINVCAALSVLCTDNTGTNWAAAKKALGSFHRIVSALDVDKVDPERKRIAGELIKGLSGDEMASKSHAAVDIFRFVNAVCSDV